MKLLISICAALGSGCTKQTGGTASRPLLSFQQDITSPFSRLRMQPGKTIRVPVVVRNVTEESWISVGMMPVLISYKWLDGNTILPVEGERTALPGIVKPGVAVPVLMSVTAPLTNHDLVLAVTLVQEGVAWFMTSGGTPLRIAVHVVTSEPVALNHPLREFSNDIRSPVSRLLARPGDTVYVPVTIRNTSDTPWSSAGTAPVTVSYRWLEAATMLPVEGQRTFIPGTVHPGKAFSVQVKVIVPSAGHHLVLAITLVQEGVAWFMSSGAAPLNIPAVLFE